MKDILLSSIAVGYKKSGEGLSALCNIYHASVSQVDVSSLSYRTQFSDILLYANRASNPSVHFRVHGQLQVRDLSVLDSEPRLGAEHCFNVYDGKKALLVAAASPEDKVTWMEEIAEAAQVRARLHYVTKPCDVGHMTV